MLVCRGCLLAVCAGMDCPDLGSVERDIVEAQRLYVDLKMEYPFLKGLESSNLKQTKGAE